MNVTHLGVYVTIIKDGKILLVKKSRGPYKGKLDLPGGKLEHGEDFIDGATREVEEETGVTIKKAKLHTALTTVVDFEDERGMISMYQVGIIVRALDFDDSNLIEDMDLEDSNGGSWCSLNDLSEGRLSPFAKKMVTKLKTRK